MAMRVLGIAIAVVLVGGAGYAGWRYAQGDLPIQQYLQLLGMVAPPAAVPAPSKQIDLGPVRATIETELRAIPEYSPFFARLQELFPADYAQVLDDFAGRAANGEPQDVDRYFSDASRALRQTRGIIAAKAGPEALARLFDSQAAVLKILGSTDPHLCVDFLYGGAAQPYFDFSRSHRALVAAVAQAGLDAIVDGHTKNIERPRPSDADFDQLEKALAQKGLDKAEIGALIDGKSPDPPINDARLCTMGQLDLEALKSLPDDLRQRIYGLTIELMARS
jgi:hypothetical protein